MTRGRRPVAVGVAALALLAAALGRTHASSRWGVAGWYALGPRPGDPGSAVILGRVD